MASVRSCLFFSLAALFCYPAGADDLRSALLADGCAACHGPDGESPGAIPSLRGHDAETLASMLKGYKQGEIEGTVMNRIARGYSDKEIEALSHYISARQR